MTPGLLRLFDKTLQRFQALVSVPNPARGSERGHARGGRRTGGQLFFKMKNKSRRSMASEGGPGRRALWGTGLLGGTSPQVPLVV